MDRIIQMILNKLYFVKKFMLLGISLFRQMLKFQCKFVEMSSLALLTLEQEER